MEVWEMEVWEADPPFRCILVAVCRRFAGAREEFHHWAAWLGEKGTAVVCIPEPSGPTP